MSTRSLIAIKEINREDVKVIYCHHDGYFEYVGAVLLEHYNNPDKVRELIKLGNLSSLGATLKDTVAYMRDRGESEQEATVMTNSDALFNKDDAFAEYRYLYDVEKETWFAAKGVFTYNGKLPKPIIKELSLFIEKE